MDTEEIDFGEVRIKQEHAYACSEGTSPTMFKYEFLEDDPLKITAEDVRIKSEIETEDVQVKTELEHQNVNSVKEEMDLECGDIAEIEHSSDSNLICDFAVPSYNSVNVGFAGHDVVPKSVFIQLQNKYKNVFNELTKMNKAKEVLKRENRSLKSQISRHRVQAKSEYNLKSSMRQSSKDLKTEKMLSSRLQNEIQQLLKENGDMQSRLNEFISIQENYEYLEKTIISLKNQVSHFQEFHKVSLDNLTSIKANIRSKESSNKVLQDKLEMASLKISHMHQKLLILNKLRSTQVDTLKKKNELEKQLTECMKLRHLYEDHATLIKREMMSKVKEQNKEIDHHRKEVVNLSKVCIENEATIKLMREKYKSLIRAQESAAQTQNKINMQTTVKIAALNEQLSAKTNECVTLREEIAILKVELEKNRVRICEYCGM